MSSDFHESYKTLLDIETNYKNNESNKIIQVFHITVLIILGFYNLKLDKNSYEALYLLISLSFIAGAYLFWYLSDIMYLKTQLIIHGILNNDYDTQTINNTIQNKLVPNLQKNLLMQVSCFISALCSHIFIFLSALHYFKLVNNYCAYTSIILVVVFGSYHFYDINIRNSDISRLKNTKFD